VTWSKLDDTLHGHPKALDAGLEAMGLWTLTLSHCGAYLTDGWVKRAAALRFAGATDVERLSATLVHVGLWEPHPSGDGWQVHDFLAYNPPAETVRAQRAELSAKRAEAGRKGAAKRWQTDGKPDGKPSGRSSNPKGLTDLRDGNLPSRLPSTRNGPDPDPVPVLPPSLRSGPPSAPASDDGKTETDTTLPGTLALDLKGPRAPKSATRKKAATHCPGPEETTEAIDAWCRGQGIPPASEVPLVDRMIGWHQKAGKPRASWLRTWQDWQREEPRFAELRSSDRAPNAMAPVEGAAVKAARQKREDGLEEGRRNWSPIPKEALAAVGAVEADREQAARARVASTRTPSAPVSFGGVKVQRQELPLEESQAERQRQAAIGAERAADFDGGTKKAEAR